jgi:hypothetical protein
MIQLCAPGTGASFASLRLSETSNLTTLVAERPAMAATWRDDQIEVVGARVFAGANGKIVLCGDIGLFGSELHGGFELQTPRAATALPVREILRDVLAEARRRQPTTPSDRRFCEKPLFYLALLDVVATTGDGG